MPGLASDIVITYDGNDITNDVLFASTRFDSQLAAVPGTFELTVKDMDRSRSYVTGKQVTLEVDGVKLFGGYVLQVSRQYAFPADNTANLANVKSRQWVLSGVDYNIILDKRVLRNTSNYTEQIPKSSSGSPIYDGAVIRTYLATYFDLPAGFDSTSTARIRDTHQHPNGFVWPTQGSTLRSFLEGEAQFGSVFYVDGDMQLWFLSVEDTIAPWGFSDKPDGVTRIGFREGEYIEDGTAIVNDALVWGGSEWAGDGDVVFSRRQNATSISEHGRWQVGEVLVGNADYKSQAEVDARAKVIVDGNESGTFAEGSKGLVNPEQQFKAIWFGINAPSAQHLKPGDVAPIDLWVFSEDAGATPFTVNLPLRQITVTFPTLTEDGLTHVMFEGFFGIQNSDPYWLWHFLRTIPKGAFFVSTADDSTNTQPPYGTMYSGTPTPTPNGSATVFTIPWGYIGRTLSVFRDGRFLIRNTDYTENNPAAGEFTMNTAPSGSQVLYVQARLSG